ncbi:MAG: ABC transporter substrate-binding protein [Patescibacteria group bacterium]
MFRLKQIFFALTRGEKASFFLASGAAVISGFILFTVIFLQSTEAVPASGGDYTEGLIGQPSLVNPVLASSEVDKALVRLVFANAYDIAEKIEPSPDGRIWKIRLKENLTWQDGEKMTSDDIVFTVQKIQDPQSSSPLANAWQGIAAQRLSEIELQLSLVNPYAFFPEILGGLYIVPKHIFEEIPPANWRLSDYNVKPIGSGPYKFLSFEKRSTGFIATYRLTAWEENFSDMALIQDLNFRFFTNTSDLVQSFNSGQIDALSGISPDTLQAIERSYETVSFRLPNYYAVFLNQSKNIALKEKVVRNALETLINRDWIVGNALAGYGEVARGPIPQEATYFDAKLENNSTSSLESVSAELDAAGWKMNDKGFREKTIQKTKIPLEFTLKLPNIDFLVKTADILKAEWEKAGIKINLEVVDSGDAISEAIKGRDYEALLFGNVLNRSLDLFSFWHSSERFHPGLNVALYNNKKADALIESIRQNIDEASRREEFLALQKIIADDLPAIFLYSPYYIYVSNKNVRGLEAMLISEPAERFTGAEKWYLRTARVLR